VVADGELATEFRVDHAAYDGKYHFLGARPEAPTQVVTGGTEVTSLLVQVGGDVHAASQLALPMLLADQEPVRDVPSPGEEAANAEFEALRDELVREGPPRPRTPGPPPELVEAIPEPEAAIPEPEAAVPEPEAASRSIQQGSFIDETGSWVSESEEEGWAPALWASE
jgi:hypothetical protein